MAMTKLEEVEAAVAQLSPEELAQLRAWLDELEERLFDEKIARDAAAGKLDKLEAKACEDEKAGRVQDLQVCGTPPTRTSGKRTVRFPNPFVIKPTRASPSSSKTPSTDLYT